MKIFNKKLLGLLISVVFVIFIFKNLDIKETLRAFKNINPFYLLLVIPSCYLSFAFRIFRWKLLISDKVSMKNLFSSIFTGFMLNYYLPARAGDLYRAHLLGKKENLSRTKIFASVMVERIFDGITLFFILFCSVLFFCSKFQAYKSYALIYNLSAITGFLFVGGLVFLILLARYSHKLETFIKKAFQLLHFTLNDVMKSKIQDLTIKLNRVIGSFTGGLDVLKSFDLTFKSILLSFVVWFFEGVNTFLIIKSFGIHIVPVYTLLILCITVLSTLIPSGPAALGPYQFGYILAMGLFSVSKETAVAISLVNQFTVICLVSVVGIACVLKDNMSLKDFSSEEIKNA